MSRLLLTLFAVGCAPEATLRLDRPDDACEVLSALRVEDAVVTEQAPPVPADQREPVADLLPGLDVVRDAWHTAAGCGVITRGPAELGYIARPFQAHTWLLQDAVDRARGGDVDGALAELTDVWQVAGALRYGMIMSGIAGETMRRGVLEVVGAEIPADVARRWAASLPDDAAVSLDAMFHLDQRGLELAPWDERVRQRIPCLAIEPYTRRVVAEVDASPRAEQSAAWRDAFTDDERSACSWVGAISLLFEERDAVDALRAELAR
ncbi:MAG TPA: hypothetical protein PKA64_09735 [Myxococcota bacterium]|nr:hypothetical protein [Myxococcota bacterium]